MRNPATARSLRALSALALGGVLLAGCAGGPSGSVGAADEEATSATLQYREITGQPAMLAGVATAVSRADAVTGVMREHGVRVSDADVATRIAEEGMTVPDGGLSEGSTKLWRSVYEFQDASQLPEEEQAKLTEELSAALGENEENLNPRYAMTPEGYPLLPTWVTTTTRTSAEQQQMQVPAGHP